MNAAVRDTSNGPLVIASGEGDEFFAVVKQLSRSKKDRFELIDPTPLAVLAAELPARPKNKAR